VHIDTHGDEDKFFNQLLPYKSRLWHLLHTASKPMIRKSIDYIYDHCYADTYEKKLRDGWINPEIKLFHDHIGEVMLERTSRTIPPSGSSRLYTQRRNTSTRSSLILTRRTPGCGTT